MTQVPAGVVKVTETLQPQYRSASAVPDRSKCKHCHYQTLKRHHLLRAPAFGYKDLCNGVQADPGLLPGRDARSGQYVRAGTFILIGSRLALAALGCPKH